MATNSAAAATPPWNRSPSAMPTVVITMVATSVLTASASRVPVRALARWTGIVQNRLSRPLSRSPGMERAAASDPDMPPARAHIDTTVSRLSLPVSRVIDLLTSM